MPSIMRSMTTFLNLQEGEDDKQKTLEIVSKNISFRGANLWILACAIIVASVGLNVNSAAVIIGAMLISPLMGPIVGAGFALGIYDFDLLKRSLRNLANATLVSLAVSTLYFFISPFKDVQSELLARTSPNIYDILIAFFGGIVGVIAVTRVEKGNPIPGVAIATALMPPLCTAGFGLATANWSYFFGAFYLYCINCVFIGIATFLIIKYLKYPPKKQVDERQQRQVRNIITILILVMMIPSGYLAYSLYKEQEFKRNVENFINDEFIDNGYTIIYKKTKFNSSPKELHMGFLSKRFEKKEIAELNRQLKNYELAGTKLTIIQDSTDRLMSLKGDILNEIRGNKAVDEKDIKIARLEKVLAENTFEDQKIFNESKVLFPGITSLSISNNRFLIAKDSTFKEITVIVGTKEELDKAEKVKLGKWLKTRLGVSKVSVYRKE